MTPAHPFLPSLLLLTLGVASCVAQDPVPGSGQAATPLLHALQQGGLRTPLTLWPVRVLGRADGQVADVLGLVLEQQGLADLDATAGSFDAADTPWEQVPARFAAHVQASARPGMAKRYALYAEFLGDPKKGPTEVRFVVVDPDGAVVLVDRQTPADAAFRRTAGRDPDPLGCSRLVADRLLALAGWQPAPGSVGNGAFAARWEQRAGGPTPREREAMAQRRASLQKDLAKARIAVQPIVWDGNQANDPQRLVGVLQQQLGVAAVQVGVARLQVPATSNQQRRLWDLAKALQKEQRERPVDADYVVAVDAALSGKSGFVDVVVVDRAGEFVLADFTNDQHPAFQKRAPKNAADAEWVAVDRLCELLR